MLDKKKFYINGKWVSPSKPNDFEVINPSTEETCAIISLGSKETTLLKLTSAYCSFVNGGKLVEPILIDRIQDSEGNTIFNSEKRKIYLQRLSGIYNSIIGKPSWYRPKFRS